MLMWNLSPSNLSLVQGKVRKTLMFLLHLSAEDDRTALYFL